MSEHINVTSVGFPRMFRGSSTNVVTNNEATLNNIHLLLSSGIGEFSFDPQFGIRVKRYMFEQNNYVLKDILIDEIYTQLCTFIPQIYLERKNITIEQEGSKLYAKIYCKNRTTFELNTYNLELYNSEKEE